MCSLFLLTRNCNPPSLDFLLVEEVFLSGKTQNVMTLPDTAGHVTATVHSLLPFSLGLISHPLPHQISSPEFLTKAPQAK